MLHIYRITYDLVFFSRWCFTHFTFYQDKILNSVPLCPTILTFRKSQVLYKVQKIPKVYIYMYMIHFSSVSSSSLCYLVFINPSLSFPIPETNNNSHLIFQQGWKIQVSFLWLLPCCHVGVSKNMGKPPNHPFVHRVFHYFHHPFWGVKHPYFWKHPYSNYVHYIPLYL